MHPHPVTQPHLTRKFPLSRSHNRRSSPFAVGWGEATRCLTALTAGMRAASWLSRYLDDGD